MRSTFVYNCSVNILVMLALVLTIMSCDQSLRSKPNIIVILADDAGYADFGFMGSDDILTPSLDAIASDGTIFTDAHISASVCSPSRAGLLTGRYQQRFGHECNLEPNQPLAFDSTEITIAEFLQQNGYATSMFGKWHLGEQPHQHPLKNGFDYFWGFLSGSRSYFPIESSKRTAGRTILENFEPVEFEGYLTDVIGGQAVRYLSEEQKEDKPFFMYLAFNAPHTPMHAKDEDVAMFGDDHPRPVYAAMLWSMDEAVGKVIATLKAKGIYDHTMIYFLSDNGGAHNNHSSVEPLKGWKGNQYEGGIRVPFTVTWKEGFESGRVFDGLSSSLDIYATIASVVSPDAHFANRLDGVSLVPYLKGELTGDPHEVLFWRKDEMASIRSGDYKLITLKDSISVLYDVRSDPREVNDIGNTSQELADSLTVHRESWEDQLKDPIWREPEDWNFVTRSIYEDLMGNRAVRYKSPKDLPKAHRPE